MKNQSVVTVNALAAVLVSAGLLSACAGESAGEAVGYTNQRPERSDVEQRPSGSDYDRPLPNPAQPVPPAGDGSCSDVCSGAGACTNPCLLFCDELPAACENIVRQVASCMGQLGGDCSAAFLACGTQHLLDVAVCAGEVEIEVEDEDAF